MKHLQNITRSRHVNKCPIVLKYVTGVFLLLFSLMLSAQNGTSNTCTTNCHKRTVKKDLLHGPTATDCTSCHEPNGKEHPVEDVSAFSYFAEGADLCYSCHTELKEEHSLKYVHKPTKNGECTQCHEVHSSNNEKLVFTSAPDMCFFCHSDLEKDRETAKTVHTASFEEGACLQCHNPHASAEKKLLTDKGRQLCLNCHNKTITRADKSMITNIEKHLKESTHEHRALNSKCTSCHNPHFSERERLLTEEFTVGIYAEGLEENFALCFQCHDTDLFNLETTDASTEFREGDRNLHFVHVNKIKARNCTACHDVHGAKNTKLIAAKVKFGRWDMPLNYIPNDNGGTCATGCHEKRNYSRQVAIEKTDD